MTLSSPPLHNLSSLISSHGIATATARAPSRRHFTVLAAASDTTTSLKVNTFEEGNLVRPKWTGDTPLSRLVRALISFKPLYSVLKLGARQVLIRLTIASTHFVTFFLCKHTLLKRSVCVCLKPTLTIVITSNVFFDMNECAVQLRKTTYLGGK